MPGNDLTLLREAALSAGEIALRFFDGGAESWEKPGNQGLVTEADLAVDAHLAAQLTAARPGYGWLSEETQDDPHRLSTPRVFVIDPIDGTRSFANGDRTWALSLAVVEGGVPVAAVIHLPARRLTYTAETGGGAWLNGKRRLSATATEGLEGADILANRLSMEPVHWPGGVPRIRREFRASLAYRMALVAEGRFDAMATFRDTWDWDIAAGALIAAEAGATVTDGFGQALTFNTLERHNPGLVCAAPGVHPALMAHRRPD
ncbi:3'(2'),5'-bisphosphate nucleotidase CysQ [Mangrovicoccus algicola]|uniref:3'(2'),5'-bisphosphate nucleotidase CysQ n=1 Tax=Mangrovicoccus algicola TaxID=2771008 RepID=A0A8J6YT85_9RHOB|nr:3'(2'),5'-bisphosphate nucleotidase CysQ [Mangrovicoccus algicola]MBE3638763.1 3'(2'),5'-bisphosphate nucleotidase CysQ [Mangrovicoccus algicola]